MIETAEALPESIQRAVDLGISGIDIMHGELKIMMLVAEQELANAQAIEEHRLLKMRPKRQWIQWNANTGKVNLTP